MLKKVLCVLASGVLIMSAGIQSSALPVQTIQGSGVSVSENQFTGNSLQDLRIFYQNSVEPDDMEIVNKYISIYQDDDQFSKHYAKAPDSAISMVKSVIDSKLDGFAMTYGSDGEGIYRVYGVPILKQNKNNWCGAASTLQVITSYGNDRDIPGSTSNDKQSYLANSELNIGNGSAIVYQIRDTINKYIEPFEGMVYHHYSYVNYTNLSYDDFVEDVWKSLYFNGPLILHAIPKYLSYYPSTATTGHYITVTGIDIKAGTITVNDCHYDNRYNGVHTIPIREAYNSIHSQRDRYLIYLPA